MKANQKFVKADEAVSPVIGVILMVAITVVLAAVVFVLVSDLGDTGNAPEQAAVQVESHSPGFIDILLISAGDNAPYAAADVTLNVAGASCSGADAAVTFPTDWNSGGTVKVDGGVTSTCGSAFAAGDNDVQVVVTILGTVVFNGPVNVEGNAAAEVFSISAVYDSVTPSVDVTLTGGANAPYDHGAEYTVTLARAGTTPIAATTCTLSELNGNSNANPWADATTIWINAAAGPDTNCAGIIANAVAGDTFTVEVTARSVAQSSTTGAV